LTGNSKWQRVIDRMKIGAVGPDIKHISQLKVQIAAVRITQDQLWPGMAKCPGGFLYYASRDNPSDTAEFYVQYDQNFWEKGLAQLAEWRELFLQDKLPGDNDHKTHPFGWKWSYTPCLHCDFKKEVCKPDYKDKVEVLSESNGVRFAKMVYGQEEYDPEAARAAVLDQWDEDDPTSDRILS